MFVATPKKITISFVAFNTTTKGEKTTLNYQWLPHSDESSTIDRFYRIIFLDHFLTIIKNGIEGKHDVLIELIAEKKEIFMINKMSVSIKKTDSY